MSHIVPKNPQTNKQTNKNNVRQIMDYRCSCRSKYIKVVPRQKHRMLLNLVVNKDFLGLMIKALTTRKK